jgi:hypothetical protein
VIAVPARLFTSAYANTTVGIALSAALLLFVAVGAVRLGRVRELRLYQVASRHPFGDRMLDLEPRVHLEEVERVVRTEQELDRAGAAIAHRLGERHRRERQPLAQGLVHRRRRALLDHLLVAALERALALEQVDRVAAAVAQHLDLDVARALDQLVEIDRVVGERRLRQALGTLERLEQRGLVARHAHALAAAAECGLHHHRVAELARRLGERARAATRGARHDGHGGALGDRARGALVAHRTDLLGRRANEHEARTLDQVGEVGVLGQEAVAGMDRLGARRLRRRDHRLGVEVRRARLGRTDQHRVGGDARVERAAIGLGEDGDRRDAHLAQRRRNPTGDLATIGDEDALEHGGAV